MQYSISRRIDNAVLEVLEDRRLMSAVSMEGSTLRIAGESRANSISVDLSTDLSSIVVTLNNDAAQSFPLSAVKRLKISGGPSDDRISVSPALNLKASINGRAGNDTIMGSGGSDSLSGGNGDDVLVSNGGRDQLRGADGNDVSFYGTATDFSTGVAAGASPNLSVNSSTLSGITFVLYDADTDQRIVTLTEGATINLATLPTRNLNIVAIPEAGTKSVKFTLDDSWTRVENYAPYSLGEDYKGDLSAWTPAVGQHILQATTYTQREARGPAGSTATMSFAVIDQPANPAPEPTPTPTPVPQPTLATVSSFTLIDAVTNQPITGYTNITADAVVDLREMGGSRQFAIRANPSGGKTGSIVFGLGANANYRVENYAPYALSGNTGNDYFATSLTLGTYTVEATVYGGQNGTGVKGESTTLSLQIVDTTPIADPEVAPNNPTPPPPPPPPVTPPANDGGIDTDNNTGTATPSIEFKSTSLLAGQAFHANALRSTLTNGGVTDYVFEWDFGDSGSRHNVTRGFNAAHIYAQPGTYTVTLKLIDAEGRSSTKTSEINVKADHRRTIYVSNSGDDSNDGLSEGLAVKSVGRVMQSLSDSTRVLFARGQTFDLQEGFGLGGRKNITVGAFGQGSQPVLREANQSINALISTYGASDITIRDIAFDSKFANTTDKSGAANALHIGGTNIAVLNCTFINVNDAVNTDRVVNGFLIQDSTAPNITSVRGYFTWCTGSDFVIQGNNVANSTREHNVRLGGLQRLAIFGNNFTNVDGGINGDLKDFYKATVNLQSGSYLYVSGNSMTGGTVGVGPLGGPDGSRNPGDRTQFVVLEDNVQTNASLRITAGTENLVVRNNVINMSGNSSIHLVNLDLTKDANGQLIYPDRGLKNIKILGNTSINTASKGRFVELTGPTDDNQITLTNNVYRAPNLVPGSGQTAIVYAQDADLSSFAEIGNNIWEKPDTTIWVTGATMYVWANWSDARGYLTADQWNAQSKVGTDAFTDVQFTGETYQIKLGALTAGSTLRRAA